MAGLLFYPTAHLAAGWLMGGGIFESMEARVGLLDWAIGWLVVRDRPPIFFTTTNHQDHYSRD
jgi:hypothetical protein